jgi:hypothetical protein
LTVAKWVARIKPSTICEAVPRAATDAFSVRSAAIDVPSIAFGVIDLVDSWTLWTLGARLKMR